MNLETPLRQISGIGYVQGTRLAGLDLITVNDLITHFPFRYDDLSEIVEIAEAQLNTKVTLKGEIWSIKNIFTRNRKVITQAIFNDGTNSINLTWFNQSYLAKSIKVGDKLQIAGKLTKYNSKLSIVAPIWERLSVIDPNLKTNTKTLHTGGLIPVYSETEGLSSRYLRTKISAILPKVSLFIEDHLPEEIRGKMLDLKTAYSKIHFPENYNDVEAATKRLAFDEIFWIQLKTLMIKKLWKDKPTVKVFEIPADKLEKLLESLPFKLTDAQQKVLDEILDDLRKGSPMNRLVQGEVGSGKTVVAAIAAYIAHLNGFKTFYMAPTEILAFQHHANFKRILEPFGLSIGLYTGSKKFTKPPKTKAHPPLPNPLLKGEGDTTQTTHKIPSPSRERVRERGAALETPNIIIGTHALISEKLIAEDVGLIIIDEQQRFGVQQRTILRNKAKIPHFLTMTATPIPRTVALTLYGDLDLSIINELPKGRIPIKTHYVPQKKRDDSYKFIQERVDAGEQVYIITPLIEVSETMLTVKAAKDEFETLQKVFPKLKLGLLHGRLKPKEKDQVLIDFKDKKLDILVSTSVVEVGVDVPNATIMVIEGAERFGLAQLHQLRGRVGRGAKQSYCLLFSTNEESGTISRLRNLETISDGLKLSEIDLKIRGSGEIFGRRQSGRFDLKIADFSDLELIEKTRAAANKLIDEDMTLSKYPEIRRRMESVDQVSPD